MDALSKEVRSQLELVGRASSCRGGRRGGLEVFGEQPVERAMRADMARVCEVSARLVEKGNATSQSRKTVKNINRNVNTAS